MSNRQLGLVKLKEIGFLDVELLLLHYQISCPNLIYTKYTVTPTLIPIVGLTNKYHIINTIVVYYLQGIGIKKWYSLEVGWVDSRWNYSILQPTYTLKENRLPW